MALLDLSMPKEDLLGHLCKGGEYSFLFFHSFSSPSPALHPEVSVELIHLLI